MSEYLDGRDTCLYTETEAPVGDPICGPKVYMNWTAFKWALKQGLLCQGTTTEQYGAGKLIDGNLLEAK